MKFIWFLVSVGAPFCWGFFANPDLIDTDPGRAFVGGLLFAVWGGAGFGFGWTAAKGDEDPKIPGVPRVDGEE